MISALITVAIIAWCAQLALGHLLVLGQFPDDHAVVRPCPVRGAKRYVWNQARRALR